jgi:hypothetical protein
MFDRPHEVPSDTKGVIHNEWKPMVVCHLQALNPNPGLVLEQVAHLGQVGDVSHMIPRISDGLDEDRLSFVVDIFRVVFCFGVSGDELDGDSNLFEEHW